MCLRRHARLCRSYHHFSLRFFFQDTRPRPRLHVLTLMPRPRPVPQERKLEIEVGRLNEQLAALRLECDVEQKRLRERQHSEVENAMAETVQRERNRWDREVQASGADLEAATRAREEWASGVERRAKQQLLVDETIQLLLRRLKEIRKARQSRPSAEVAGVAKAGVVTEVSNGYVASCPIASSANADGSGVPHGGTEGTADPRMASATMLALADTMSSGTASHSGSSATPNMSASITPLPARKKARKKAASKPTRASLLAKRSSMTVGVAVDM